MTTTARVVRCYTFWDFIFPALGLSDYTEGIYPTDTTPYETAQELQTTYLLDQVGCRAGFRLLDIGCGNGRLLAAARSLGAEAIGITISAEQVARCTAQGLEVSLCDYRACPATWVRRFDGVVANGPIEHFVQPEEAGAGRADAIYRRLFEIVASLLNPNRGGRFATTTIHFDRVRPDPRVLLASPFRFRPGSPEFHLSLLHRAFGGFYPSAGQFERSAQPWFQLINEVDGTHDYYLTSEEWLHRVRQGLLSLRYGPTLWRELGRAIFNNPIQALTMSLCCLVSQSWNWQFRGPNPPMKLLRQTWEAV